MKINKRNVVREMFTLEIRRVVVPVRGRHREFDTSRRASVERVANVLDSQRSLRGVVAALKKARFDVPRPLLKQFALGGR